MCQGPRCACSLAVQPLGRPRCRWARGGSRGSVVDWIWIGVDWDWTGQIGLDWIGSRRGLRWVRFKCSGGLLGTPLSTGTAVAEKSTAVTLWGRNGRAICGSEHARHRSIRIIIDSDVGYWASRYSQGIRKRAKFRRRDQVMPCLSALVLLLPLTRGCACARSGSESPSNHCIA